MNSENYRILKATLTAQIFSGYISSLPCAETSLLLTRSKECAEKILIGAGLENGDGNIYNYGDE